MSLLNRLQSQYAANETPVAHLPLEGEIEWLQSQLSEVETKMDSLRTVMDTLTTDLAPMLAASEKRSVAIRQAEKRTSQEVMKLREKAVQARVKMLAVIESKEETGELTEEMRQKLIELQEIEKTSESQANEIREGFLAEIKAKYPLNEEVMDTLRVGRDNASRELHKLGVQQRYFQCEIFQLQEPRKAALNPEELEAYFNAVDSLNNLLATRDENEVIANHLFSAIQFPNSFYQGY